MYHATAVRTWRVWRVGEYDTERIRARSARDAAREFSSRDVSHVYGDGIRSAPAAYVSGDGAEYHVARA